MLKAAGGQWGRRCANACPSSSCFVQLRFGREWMRTVLGHGPRSATRDAELPFRILVVILGSSHGSVTIPPVAPERRGGAASEGQQWRAARSVGRGGVSSSCLELGGGELAGLLLLLGGVGGAAADAAAASVGRRCGGGGGRRGRPYCKTVHRVLAPLFSTRLWTDGPDKTTKGVCNGGGVHPLSLTLDVCSKTSALLGLVGRGPRSDSKPIWPVVGCRSTFGVVI